MRHYEEDFKRKLVRLHLEDGRSLKSLAEEYDASKASISKWIRTYREECQTNLKTNEEYDYFTENRNLKKQLEEMKKETQFLKKAAAFFAKEIE